ncbi:WbqC family protein [bacterium]|nr:WbqC family protein [bacterium]
MPKKVAILQSNYIPWKGYFDIIASVDEFIFYDEMQYTKNDWRNRNKIKTQNGLQWLTIPCETKGSVSNEQKICNTKVTNKIWTNKHWNSIQNAYAKAPYFKENQDWVKAIYKSLENEDYLCKINYRFIYAICDYLGIKTKLSFCQDYGLIEGKTERLVDLVQKAGGTEYLSGPAAKDYIDENLFKEAGIKLTWMDYSGYPEYSQLFPPFEHGVTILDLIFNTGKDARKYMKEIK